jgi:hypothetical protein
MQCFGLQGHDASLTITFDKDESQVRMGFGMVEMGDADKDMAPLPEGLESESARQRREAKAVKADDAAVPVHLWDSRLKLPGLSHLDPTLLASNLAIIREKFLLQRWKQNLRRCFISYLVNEYGADWHDKISHNAELNQDLETGRDALRRGMLSSWWGWDAGSTLFFWRWPKEFCKEARDGTNVQISGMLPKYRQPQWMVQVDLYKDKILAKLENVRE